MWKNSGWIGIGILFCICAAFLMPQTRPKANQVAKNIIVWVKAKINGESTATTGSAEAPVLLLDETLEVSASGHATSSFTVSADRKMQVKAYATGATFDIAILRQDGVDAYLAASEAHDAPLLEKKATTKVDEKGIALPAGQWVVVAQNPDADATTSVRVQVYASPK